VSPRGLRRRRVNFRSHNSCLSLGAPSPGRRRACVLFGVFFRGDYSLTGLPGDTVWLALRLTGWGGLSMWSHISAAASDALTVTALTTAFRRVGMWPPDPTVVTGEKLSKGADASVTSVDVEKLTRRRIPLMRKDMTCARVVNGTLSTASRGTVLTAPEILAALEGEAAAKAAARKAKEAGKRAREAKAEERKLLAVQVERPKSANMRAVQAAARREMWAELAFDAAREGSSRMRAMGMLGPSASKLRRRAAAARARGPSAATHSLPLHIWRRVVALQAAQAASGR